ncbi:MAG: hypothetical protein JJU45_13045 [Acidimicrobiia bacterium]|nr:hypothetical protein [Acidimicrobiia bacterium]
MAAPDTGAGIVRLDLVATAVFVAVSVAAAVWPRVFIIPVVVVSVTMFVVGTVAFLWAYVIAIGRSRTDAIGMGGLFFLAGSAPRQVARTMRWLFATQVVVAFVVSSVRIFTGVAFSLLGPMLGIGLLGLWGARHGVFPPRVLPGQRSRADEDTSDDAFDDDDEPADDEA